MSGWDAPTGSWDPGEEPQGSASDDQGYQQAQPAGGQPAGGHPAARGEGTLRAGRRGLPGYDQAQNYEPSGGYDQGTAAYGPVSGAFQEGYGPGTVPASEQPPVFGRTVPPPSQGVGGYGQGPSGAFPAYGSPDAGPAAWSGADDQDYPTQTFGQQQPADAGYGQRGAGQDYGTQAYDRPGYDRPGYDQPGYDQPGYDQPGYRQGAQPYQTEAYPQQGFEPSGYAQGGYAQGGYAQAGYADQGYGQSGHDQNDFGQAPGGTGADYQQDSRGQGAYDGFSQNGTQGSYAQDGYGQDGYGQGGYGPDAYRQDAYGQDAYGQPGFDQPGGQSYGGDDLSALGLAPRPTQHRSGPSRQAQRSQQRLSGIRMVLYLVAAVVGVVLIVFLVVRLTKTSSNSAPAPATSPTAAPTASGFVFIKAANVGSFPLNTAATKQYTKVAEEEAAPIVHAIKASGAGHPGQEVVAVYDLSSVSSTTSSDFKAIAFNGFTGTFNPDAVITYMKTDLTSTRTVSAGPNGGKMMCGYNTSGGTKASECLWVTPTTFGQVEFIVGQAPAKYNGTSELTLEVRKAVEVKAG